MPGAALDNPLLRAALEYAGMGWKVVPLFSVDAEGRCECHQAGHCDSAGKHPRIMSWQKEASSDEELIARWWERWPRSNVGVQLGPASGIIDLECDSEEAEASLLSLFGGEFPTTPTFQARRGKHRLFRWRADLPKSDQASFKIGEIDFKLGGSQRGSQSVFPPSMRKDGVAYKWLIHPSQCDIAAIDDETLARIWNHEGGAFKSNGIANPDSARLTLYKSDKVSEGSRDNTLYAECCNIWREKTIVYGPGAIDSQDIQGQVFRTLRAWNIACCDPPLPEEDVHKKVESARRFISENINSDIERRGRKLTALGLEWRDGEWWPGQWGLDVIEDDPPSVKLKVPFYAKPIELTMNHYNSHHDVHLAVMNHTGSICLDDRPGFWSTVWNGSKGNVKDKRPPTRGLKAKLLDIATRVPGVTERKKKSVVADFAWRWLEAATPLTRGEPSRMTKMFVDEDGSIVFRFSAMVTDTQFQSKELTRIDLSRVIREAGARELALGATRMRFMVLDKKSQTALRDMANGEDPKQDSRQLPI